MMPALRSDLEIHAVDRQAVHLSARGEHVLDVLFDGARVWSFHVPRDADTAGEGLLAAPWPGMLRRYLKGHATITLRTHVGNRVLFEQDVAFDDSGERCRVVDEAGRPLATNKTGRLRRTFATRTPEMVQPLLDQLEHVLHLLADEMDVVAFPAYGTLLGAVREGNFIGHDDDVDVGYLSNHEHPYDVITESFRMQRMLQRHGYQVRRYSGASFKVFIQDADGALRGLDVFGGFFSGGLLNLLGEVRTSFPRDWIVPLGNCSLEGRTLPCPRAPDRLLAAMYGPGWRTPDPAFHFRTPNETRLRFDGWFRGLRAKRDRWDRLHAAKGDAPPGEPHEYARWVADREVELSGKQLVDVGCGRGADALWFARAGAEVIGYDYASSATPCAAAIAEREGLPARFEWLNLAELRSVLPTGALLAARPAPRIMYARFVADAVSERVRCNLWRFADMSLRGGGRLYLQFLTGAQRGAQRFAAANMLRPLPVELAVAELEARNATVIHRETLHLQDQGRGPQVARLVVEWPTR